MESKITVNGSEQKAKTFQNLPKQWITMRMISMQKCKKVLWIKKRKLNNY